MNNITADAESTLRLSIFIVFFMVLAAMEMFFPRRELSYSKSRRWLSNLGMSVFNTLFLRIVLPIAGVGAALLAQEKQWGLLNMFQLPAWASIILFLVIFDLVIYWQHRLFHMVPFLWRFHRMHHTDPDYDLTTGNRFHPVSILFSSVIKVLLIFLMGPLSLAVILAEVILNAMAMFNHSNIKLPGNMDKFLRLFLVTPDMHRIHHSVNRHEHNKNFGFNLSIWDRFFSSYIANPELGQMEMEIGLDGFSDRKSISFFQMLIQPFGK